MRTIEWVPFDRPVEWFFTRRARSALTRLAPQFDLIWIHGVWDPICLTASRVARKLGVPYVVTPHGGLDPWTFSQRPWRKKLGLMLGFRAMLQHALFLHTVTQDEKNAIARLGLKTPMEVIPNGVFAEEFAHLPPAGAFVAKHSFLTGRRYVLFFGRLHFMKGLDYLADAFALIAPQFPDLDLVVIGPDDGAQADFERRVAEASLQKRVHFLGALYGPDRYGAMVDALCFCLPSRREGFSMAILETLACGCPVVISEQCHFPEVATWGVGMVVANEKKKIGMALAHFAGETFDRVNAGKKAHALVLESYTWPQAANKTLELCQKALGKPLVETAN